MRGLFFFNARKKHSLSASTLQLFIKPCFQPWVKLSHAKQVLYHCFYSFTLMVIKMSVGCLDHHLRLTDKDLSYLMSLFSIGKFTLRRRTQIWVMCVPCLSPYVTAIDQRGTRKSYCSMLETSTRTESSNRWCAKCGFYILYSKRVYCLVKEFTSVLHDNVVKILVCFCAAQVKSVCVLRSGAKRH